MPTRFPRPRRRGVQAIVAALAALVLVAGASVGCEPQEDDGTLANGLLILSGEIGGMKLRVLEEGDPGGRAIALPDSTTTWVAAGRTNVLVATLVDGRTFVSGPLGDEDPDWRLVEAVTTADVPPEPPLYFGTWDPQGGAYAQLGTDFTSGGVRVVVTDPALEGATEAALDETQPRPVPPAWIDDDRIVLVAGSADDAATVIVDTTSGDASAGPRGTAVVATSADALVTAAWAGAGQPVTVLATNDWLDGTTGAIRIDPPESGWTPGALALDGPGRRLAILWVDGAKAAGVTVHAAARDWGRAATIDVGDVQAASISWLR
jgi:hypothetical protein